MKEEEKECYYITVIGIDRKLHLALPWENKCKCGCKILKKNPTKQEKSKYFSCYPCTY